MQCHCTSKGFLDNTNTQGSQCTRLRAVEVGQGVCKYTSKGDRNCARPVHWGTLTGAKHFATENKTLVDPKSNSLACQSNVLINQLLSFTTCTRLQLRQFEGVDFQQITFDYFLILSHEWVSVHTAQKGTISNTRAINNKTHFGEEKITKKKLWGQIQEVTCMQLVVMEVNFVIL